MQASCVRLWCWLRRQRPALLRQQRAPDGRQRRSHLHRGGPRAGPLHLQLPAVQEERRLGLPRCRAALCTRQRGQRCCLGSQPDLPIPRIPEDGRPQPLGAVQAQLVLAALQQGRAVQGWMCKGGGGGRRAASGSAHRGKRRALAAASRTRPSRHHQQDSQAAAQNDWGGVGPAQAGVCAGTHRRGAQLQPGQAGPLVQHPEARLRWHRLPRVLAAGDSQADAAGGRQPAAPGSGLPRGMRRCGCLLLLLTSHHRPVRFVDAGRRCRRRRPARSCRLRADRAAADAAAAAAGAVQAALLEGCCQPGRRIWVLCNEQRACGGQGGWEGCWKQGWEAWAWHGRGGQLQDRVHPVRGRRD